MPGKREEWKATQRLSGLGSGSACRNDYTIWRAYPMKTVHQICALLAMNAPLVFAQVNAPHCADMLKYQAPGWNLAIAKADATPASANALLRTPPFCRVEGVIDRRTGADGKPYGIG